MNTHDRRQVVRSFGILTRVSWPSKGGCVGLAGVCRKGFPFVVLVSRYVTCKGNVSHVDH